MKSNKRSRRFVSTTFNGEWAARLTFDGIPERGNRRFEFVDGHRESVRLFVSLHIEKRIVVCEKKTVSIVAGCNYIDDDVPMSQ